MLCTRTDLASIGFWLISPWIGCYRDGSIDPLQWSFLHAGCTHGQRSLDIHAAFPIRCRSADRTERSGFPHFFSMGGASSAAARRSSQNSPEELCARKLGYVEP